MPTFENLVSVVAVAFFAPLVLGLVEVDQSVEIIALIGLALVLFLAGTGWTLASSTPPAARR